MPSPLRTIRSAHECINPGIALSRVSGAFYPLLWGLRRHRDSLRLCSREARSHVRQAPVPSQYSLFTGEDILLFDTFASQPMNKCGVTHCSNECVNYFWRALGAVRITFGALWGLCELLSVRSGCCANHFWCDLGQGFWISTKKEGAFFFGQIKKKSSLLAESGRRWVAISFYSFRSDSD